MTPEERRREAIAISQEAAAYERTHTPRNEHRPFRVVPGPGPAPEPPDDFLDVPHPAGEATPPPKLVAYTLPALRDHVFEYRRPLLQRGETVILREGHLAEIYGLRGIGKTWFTQTLALIASSGGSALGFRCEDPVNVLYIDGEMAGHEIKERFSVLEEKLSIKGNEKLTILAADWQEQFLPRLDTLEGKMAIEPFVEAADLIVLDNRSTLFNPDSEKDPSAWQPAQDWLLALRRRRKAVVLVHHSNRQGGARGHSKPEDVMNLLLKLSRPEEYRSDQGARFTLEFDKVRGCHGLDIAPFVASLQPDGWKVEGIDEGDQAGRKLRTYVQLASDAGERPKSANAAITGAKVKRVDGLRAWKQLLEDGIIGRHPEGGFHVL
jgi:hypothetical protein